MLVLAVSHGGVSGCDPYTCSADMKSEQFKDDMDSVIKFICDERKIVREDLDEVFVMLNDNIFRHYTGDKIHDVLD